MGRNIRAALIPLVLLVSGSASHSVAQVRPTPPPPRTSPRVSVAAFGGAEVWSMSASDSFDALFGTAQLTGFGGGVQVRNLWHGLFVRGSYTTTSKTGERVFVDGSDVFPLGIPLKLTVSPLEVSAGWRTPLAKGRVAPYGGGGVLLVRYKETSDFAESGEDLDESYTGYLLFGGLEVALHRWVGVGIEGQYRGIDNAIGAGGVSSVFGESSLGGAGVRVFLVLGRMLEPSRRPPATRPASVPAPPTVEEVERPVSPRAPHPAAPTVPLEQPPPLEPEAEPAVLGVTPPVPINEDLPPWIPGFVPPAPPYEVTVEVLVGADGRVTSAKVLRSSHPAYDFHLLLAARNWRYQPARKDGRPVGYRHVVKVLMTPK